MYLGYLFINLLKIERNLNSYSARMHKIMKSDSKDIYNVKKNYISNKFC